jgi:HlyD family secretion protein
MTSANNQKAKRKRRLWIGAGVIVCLALLMQALNREGVAVEVATVRRGQLLVTVEEQGQTRVRERFIVAAPITGRLLRTHATEGMKVERGDVLATMAPPPEDPRVSAMIRSEIAAADARFREAEMRLQESETVYEQVQREAKRRKDLFERGAISIETTEKYDQLAKSARSQLDATRASLRAAKADVERMQSRLLDVEIDPDVAPSQIQALRAPVAGRVLRVYEESERVVPVGTPLIEIGDSRSLELVVDLLTEDAVQVEEGAPIHITGWGGRETLAGRVRFVEPQAFTKISALGVEEQRVNVIGDLLDPPQSLGAGYRIEAAIVTWSGDDVLLGPTRAIFSRAGSWWTFVVKDDVAHLRTLRLGHHGREQAQILDGLADGDEVILYPSDLIDDGVRVTATPALDFVPVASSPAKAVNEESP